MCSCHYKLAQTVMERQAGYNSGILHPVEKTAEVHSSQKLKHF